MVLDFDDEICGADQEKEEPNGGFPPDLRPEFCEFKDEGCQFAPSCLDCPYKHCVYDLTRGDSRFFRRIRNKEILKQFKAGKQIDELKKLFKLDERTIFRITSGKTLNKKVFKRKRGF
jgi:hypothetical protein